MRTEDERITNHEDGSPVNEPNETTPLTEPEYVAGSASFYSHGYWQNDNTLLLLYYIFKY